MRFKSEYAKFMNLEDGGVANTLKQKNTQEGYTQVAFGSNTTASNKQLAGTNGATMANTNPDFDNPGDSPF